MMSGMAALGEMDKRVRTVHGACMAIAVGMAIVLGNTTLRVGAPEGAPSKPQ